MSHEDPSTNLFLKTWHKVHPATAVTCAGDWTQPCLILTIILVTLSSGFRNSFHNADRGFRFSLAVVVHLLSRVWLLGSSASQTPLPSTISQRLSESCPLRGWCYITMSSSVVPFSFCLQSFPASGSFLISQFFTSGGKVLEFQHQSFQWLFGTDSL